ncbi:hypothetical protein L3X38_014529 [Prunus dulcis]|uniref:Uncharacterized protein n=1 Tax=Prunus dulcis TaxID=3755 RepID=A0AAD4WND7_PRUDU|nr:hypothetical protein L3X38_014529 [Prunus dulcis]
MLRIFDKARLRIFFTLILIRSFIIITFDAPVSLGFITAAAKQRTGDGRDFQEDDDIVDFESERSDERFQDPQNDPFSPDINDPALPDDVDALFDDVYPNNNTQAQQEEEEEEKDFHKELVSMGLLKWRKGRPLAEAPRFIEKAPKIVNVMKVSPRAIQQPR